MNKEQFKEWLEYEEACSESMEWVEGKDSKQAWEECTRGDWLVWLLIRCYYPSTQRIEEAVLDCAEARLNLLGTEEDKEGEKLLRKLIQVCRDRKGVSAFFAEHRDFMMRESSELGGVCPVRSALRGVNLCCLSGAIGCLEMDGKFTESPAIIRAKIPYDHILFPEFEEP